MTELDALSRELRRQLPAVPEDLAPAQLGRLLRDARVRQAPLPGRWLLLAVSAVVIAVLSLSPWRAQVQAPVAHWLEAEHSALEQVLADGTQLRLDPGARGLPKEGESDGVRFELERGRATFDVVPQHGRVFRVLAGQHSVSVLGTRFSVAYEPQGAFSVAVERGIVLVTPAEGTPTRLTAGERFDQPSPGVAPGAQAEPPAAAPPQLSAAPAAPALSTPPSLPSAAPQRRATAPRNVAHEPAWRQLHRKREYAAALAAARVEGLARLMNELGPAPLTDLAEVARLGGDSAAALEVLSAIQRRFPASEQAAQAQFLSGRVLLQLGRSREAAVVFESYVGAHPDAALSTEALGRLLELYTHEGATERARHIAEDYLKRAPDGPYRRLARSLISGQ